MLARQSQEPMKLHILGALFVVVCLTSAFADRPGGFRVIGPGGGWAFFNPTISPQDPNTMYAHATALWRSTDGGENWNLVYPDPSSVKGVKMNSDHSSEQILADPDPLNTITALAVDPS